MSSNKKTYISLWSNLWGIRCRSGSENEPQKDLESQIPPRLICWQTVTKDPSHRWWSLMVKSLIDELFGLGPLQPLMKISLSPILWWTGQITSFSNDMARLKNLKSRLWMKSSYWRLLSVLPRVLTTCRWAFPTVDARLEDGSRVNIVIPPIALDGTLNLHSGSESRNCFDLKTWSASVRCLQTWREYWWLLLAAVSMFWSLAVRVQVKRRYQRALQYIAEDERIATIEDAAELRLQQPNLVRIWNASTSSVEQTAGHPATWWQRTAYASWSNHLLGECRLKHLKCCKYEHRTRWLYVYAPREHPKRCDCPCWVFMWWWRT